MLREITRGLINLLYPHNCILCRKFISENISSNPICPFCQGLIRLNTPPFCQKCSRHLKDPQSNPLCPICKSQKYHFDAAWGATLYNDIMRKLIHQFKYGQKTLLTKVFSQIIFSFINQYHLNISQYDIVIPIPLHPTRLRERGYNQAKLLSQVIAKEFHLKNSHQNLIRMRHTKNQAILGPKERWTNISGAFKIKQSFELDQKSILLVDDLLTTGATASEAARVLKEAGAKKVHIFALAIAH